MPVVSLPLHQPAADIVPWNRGLIPLNVLHSAPIQRRGLLWRQPELAYTFGLREAFRQNHRELGAFAGGRFQKLRKRRRHRLIATALRR